VEQLISLLKYHETEYKKSPHQLRANVKPLLTEAKVVARRIKSVSGNSLYYIA
jgi:hypothetical protein